METNSKNAVNKWDLLLSGSEKAFFEGFKNCYDDLYKLGFFLYRDADLSKECIQLLFIELWKLRARHREIQNVKEYTLTIFKRLLYKQKQIMTRYSDKVQLLQNPHDFEDFYEADNGPEKETMADHYEAGKRLSHIMDQLSDRQKQLIRMRYLEEKQINEIAVITSLTPRTIYNTLYNALAKLREALQ